MESGTSNAAKRVDVTIHIKGLNSAQPAAALDRRLVEFLCHVRDTGSVQAACERQHYSPRKAQRMLKRFSDESGLELLDYHGWHGTELTPAAVQCIALYVASLKSVQQIVEERGLPQNNTPVRLSATNENGTLKLSTGQLKDIRKDLDANQKH